MAKVVHSPEYLRLRREYIDTREEYNRLLLENDEVTPMVKSAKKDYDQAWQDFYDCGLREDMRKIIKGKKHEQTGRKN